MEMVYHYAPIVGLIFFFLVFVRIAYSAYRPSQKKILQAHASIPLREESNHE